MDPSAGFTPLIALHAIAASYVLLLGPVNIFRRRRDRAHRVIGYSWAGMMVVTCLSSFGIFGDEGFSWLHGLSAYTLFSVGAGVWSVLNGNRLAHRYNMVGAYLGTAIAFGFAALIPQRRIPRFASDDPLGLALFALLIVATAAGFILAVLGRNRTVARSLPGRAS